MVGTSGRAGARYCRHNEAFWETLPKRGLSGDAMNAFTSDGGMPSLEVRPEPVIKQGGPDLQKRMRSLFIRCRLTKRLLSTRLTTDSTKPEAIGSPWRY